MRLIVIAAAALALATPALAQTDAGGNTKNPNEAVGSGTAKALENHPAKQARRRRSQPAQMVKSQPGAAPNGTHKPMGSTGAPPYGSEPPG
jgi:hypothetical protein